MNAGTSITQKINSLNAAKPAVKKCDAIFEAGETDNGILKTSVTKCIELSGLTFSYLSGHPILDGLSFSFEAGKSYALVGRNGCGKSTLLKLLAGFYDSYEGSLLYDGEERRELSDESIYSAVTYMSQRVFLFESDSEADVHSLSGGQKQQIALKRALDSGKPVLLADEPTSALDARASAAADGLLSHGDRISIVVTHDLCENLNNYDAVIKMEHGRIVAE